MNEFMAMVIVVTIAYTIYRLFELFVRRKERLAILEKMSEGINPNTLKDSFNIFANKGILNNYTGSWAIRIGLLLVGVGLGVIIATIADIATAVPFYTKKGNLVYESIQSVGALYPACAAVFGGIGLVIAYFIERKEHRKRQDKREE